MEWGGRWGSGSGWGTYVHLWRIHVDIWQNQYNIVKLKNKIKGKNIIKKKKIGSIVHIFVAAQAFISVAVHRLLIAVASLVAEHQL